MPVASRRGIPGLEPGREDIILGGAAIIREVLRGFAKEGLTITDAGFLEGLLLDLMEKEHGWPQTLKTRFSWRAATGSGGSVHE
jgi:exopolyphosphatase/guanosine-5'-triphosphate,3'-diphosphate pyrophosphatase